jgi:hypothetical protein
VEVFILLRLIVAFIWQATGQAMKMITPQRHGLMDKSQHDSSNDIEALNRILQLTSLRDWCMERLSVLSLRSDLEDARCLTSEHLEMLVETNAWTTLWVHSCWKTRD